MFSYLHGKEFIIQDEKVVLRGLTFGEFLRIRDNKYNTEYLLYYDVAKIGIVKFKFVNQKNELVDYSSESHFDILFDDNFDFIKECAQTIFSGLSILSEKETEYIKSYLYFSNYLSDESEKIPTIRDMWDCDYCKEHKLLRRRKCTKFSKAEIETIMGSEIKEVDIGVTKAAIKKTSAKAKILAKKAKNALAETPVEEEKAFALKSTHYNWSVCPISFTPVDFMQDLSVVSKCMSAETLLVDGAMFEQPMKFVEIMSSIKHFQNEIRENDLLDSKRDRKKKAGKK